MLPHTHMHTHTPKSCSRLPANATSLHDSLGEAGHLTCFRPSLRQNASAPSADVDTAPRPRWMTEPDQPCETSSASHPSPRKPKPSQSPCTHGREDGLYTRARRRQFTQGYQGRISGVERGCSLHNRRAAYLKRERQADRQHRQDKTIDSRCSIQS